MYNQRCSLCTNRRTYSVIHRYSRAAAHLFLCLLLALSLCGFSGGCSGNVTESTAPPSAPPAAAEGPAQAGQDVTFPLPVIELAGTSEQIGAEHGRVLG